MSPIVLDHRPPRLAGAGSPWPRVPCRILLALLAWLACGRGMSAVPNVVVWGDLQAGQGLWAVPPDDLTNAVAVGGGWYHVLALRGDGAMAWWGGVPVVANGNLPPLTNAVAVAAGYFDGVALRATGTLVAWGYEGRVSGSYIACRPQAITRPAVGMGLGINILHQLRMARPPPG